MASPNAQRRQPSPALVFAGALALVLAGVAIPLLLLDRGGHVAPAATTTTAPPVSSTTTPGEATTSTAETTTTTGTGETTTTTQAETTTTEVLAREAVAVFFLAQSPENSFTGNPALVATSSLVEVDEGEPTELVNLRALLAAEQTIPPGSFDSIPDGVEVNDVTPFELDDGGPAVQVDMNQRFAEGAGGLLADMTMLNQIIYTATYGAPDQKVLFTVEGAPVEVYGSEGLVLTDPVGREDFRDSLNSIIVTQPAISDQRGFLVEGMANVFEATVSYELVDQSGDVTHEGFTTATCGTGCWGDFSFIVERPFHTLRVFWHSPEDGDPSDVVTIPVGEER